MARLTANVVLRGENGEVVTLLSGTEAPEWALPFLGGHVLDDESEQAPRLATRPTKTPTRPTTSPSRPPRLRSLAAADERGER